MDPLVRFSGALAALSLSAMVVVLAATLVLRPLGILVPSSEEIVTFLMVAMAFFGITLGMAWLHLSGSRNAQRLNTDLGVMTEQGRPAAPVAPTPAIPVAPAAAPTQQPATAPAAQPAVVPVQQNATQEKAPQGG